MTDPRAMRIFGLWTGDNPMSDVRKRCWETFDRTGLTPVLVTPATLGDWVVDHHPLHLAYPLLSPTHRADYLRAYLMHHHGGGYADIKRQEGTWISSVGRVLSSRCLLGAGYREIRGGAPRLQNNPVHRRFYVLSRAVPRSFARLTTNLMRGLFPLMIGNGAIYFKPGSIYTRYWLTEVERRLDLLHPQLRLHPGRSPRQRLGDSTGYPVPWTFLLGDITNPLSLLFGVALLRSLPVPDLRDYQ